MTGAANQSTGGISLRGERWGRLVHQQPLMLIAAAAVSGVVIDSLCSAALPPWTQRIAGVFYLVLACLGIVVLLLHRPSSGNASPIRVFTAVAVVLPLCASLHHGRRHHYHQAGILQITSEVEQPAIVEGTIDRPARLRRHPLADQPGRRQTSPWQTHLEMSIQSLRIGGRHEPTDGRALLVVDGRGDYLCPGDRVRVFGRMHRFGAPTNPGQRDLRRHYQLRRLHVRVDVDFEDQVVAIGRSNAGMLLPRRWIASMAGGSRDILLRHTGQQSGPLAVALVIGQRDFVSSDLRDLLLVTGTAHLLSVSGLHLAIVVVMAGWMATCLRMPPSARMIWILAVCLLYTAITGGRPPVLRASVLVATFMIALWVKRPSQPINTLSLAAIILVFVNPEFVFSIGVQLSFLAVATLILCGPFDHRGTYAAHHVIDPQAELDALIEHSRSTPVRYLRAATATLAQMIWFSGCVTAISTPLVWHQFHVVAPISVITNVVLGPLMFAALAAGVVTVVVGFVWEPLAIVPGSVCGVVLEAMRWLIETAAALPSGHHWLPSPPTWWVAMFYVAIALSLLLPKGRLSCLARTSWIVLWMVVAVGLSTDKQRLDNETLEATFVDVGHGTSVIIRFSERDVWLYDCGRLGNDTGSSRDIDAALWSLGVTRLNGIILSHADADHFNAIPGLLRRFGVGKIVTPPGLLDEQERALIQIRQAIERSGIPVHEIAVGRRWRQAGHAIEVLHPPSRRLRGSDNANSLVLRIECGGKTLILPGDLEPPGTESLIRLDRPPPGGVLMAPHHGALTTSAEAVLHWARPSETIVSGGRRARRVAVHQMLAATGSRVHVTSRDGAVRVRITPDGSIQIRRWSQSPWGDGH